MRLSISMNVFEPREVTVEQAMRRLKEAGFEVLDFNFCDWLFDGSPFVGEGWREWVEDISKAAKRLGLEFSQAHGPIFDKFAEDEKARWMTQMSHRTLHACALLGVKWCVFEPQTFPGAFDDEHLKALKQRNLDWFGELLKTAEKVGVGIAIENAADRVPPQKGYRRVYGSLPAELVELVDALNSEFIGICWDTGHAHIQRLPQREALKVLGKRLKATHIQDNDGISDQHLLPFHGTIDWREVVGALYEIGYEGDFTFEIHNFVRPLPDPLRDEAIRYAMRVGTFLLGLRPSLYRRDRGDFPSPAHDANSSE